jgi:hypothetical protein
MRFIYNDGGRAAAGFKGIAGDCVVRAIAIASGKPYLEVYNTLFLAAKAQKRKRGNASPRSGVRRKVYEPYLLSLGFIWTPTMKIGSGCKVHLLKEELPSGTLIVAVSKHLTTVIDGVIHDTHNPQRGEVAYMKAGPDGRAVIDRVSPERCVYGYYTKR